MKSWPDETRDRTAGLGNLRTGAPEAMKALAGIAQQALAPKALDRKTKELIAVGISVATICDDCIGFHVKAAIEQGATLQEVTGALGMAIYMGAGPLVMYATHPLTLMLSSRAGTRAPGTRTRSKPNLRARIAHVVDQEG